MTFDHKWAPIGIACTVNDDVLPDATPSDKQIQYADVSTVSYGLIGEAEQITFDSAPSRARRLAQPGDVVVSTVRTYLRAIAPVGEKESNYVFSTGFAVLRPREHLTNSRYLSYAMGSKPVIESIINASNGVGYPAINPTDLTRVRIPLPPLETQRRIAAFLDRETGQIDETITRIDRVVELVEERRWSQLAGVHRRLMEEHPTPKLDLIADEIVDGPFGSALTSAHYSDSGARVIRLGNIGVNDFKDADRAYIPLEYAKSLSSHKTLPGDIVIAGLGDSNNPVGRAAIVPENIGPAIVKADCYRVRLRDEADSRFVVHMINAPDTRATAREEARGSTRIRLNTTIAKSMRIPLPPIESQRAIAANLDAKAQQSREMYQEAERIKLLLQERRAALITTAVTGKIEV